MLYKRIIVGGTLIAALGGVLGSCSFPSYVVEERQVEIQTSLGNRATLEWFVHTEYASNNRAQRNKQYLVDNLISRRDIHQIIANPEAAKQSLVDKLKSVPHTCRKDLPGFNNYTYREDSSGVYKLTPRQLLRVYLLMEALQNEKFMRHLGTLVEKDLNDPYSEHGGLVLFDKEGKLVFRPVESEFTKQKDPKGDSSYRMPKEALETPYIAVYHFHVISEDGTIFAGPSLNDFLNLHGRILDDGEAYEIVVTKLRGRRLNIDFYSGEKKNSQIVFVTLDLGNYRY